MNIATKKLKKLIDNHFYKDLEKNDYKIISKSSLELLTNVRFDLGFKLVYIELKDKNRKFAEEIYKAHIKAFTLGSFKEPGNISKNSFIKYTKDFENIINDIYLNGFDQTKSLIPLSKNGSIANGAHRLSAAIYYEKKVDTVRLSTENQIYYFSFFKKRNVKESYIDFAASKFIEKSDNIYAALIWPAAQGKSQEIDLIIPNILYKKNIKLNPNGAHNLITQVYNNEEWLGTREDNFKGAKNKLVECFDTFKPLRLYFFQSNSIKEVLRIKQSIRNLFNIGKHSIHISDNKTEADRISKYLLNSNSVHFLNYAKPNKYIGLYKEILAIKKKHKNLADFIITGDIILSIYGIKDNYTFKIVNQNRNTENGFKKSNLIYNPENYFYYEDLKFLSLKELYENYNFYGLTKKETTAIKKLIENKGVRYILSTLKNYLNYLSVKFRVLIIRSLKSIGLYKFLKSMLNYLRYTK